MLSKSFKSGKCKTSLKLAVSRIKLLKNRREIQVKQLRRELAQLLATGQEQTARIRVEHVIREEKTMSASDLIEIYCELIVARLPIIESQKSCPIDLKEAIASLIFASPRCADIPELTDVRKHFLAKYGKEFVTSALELRPNCGVNRMIVEKLSAKAPDTETKMKLLTAIAKEHEVKWDSKAFQEELEKPKEDLLNGSSSFTRANKMPMEPLNVNFSPDVSQTESASKKFQTGTASKPTSFNSSSHTNLRTSTPLAPPAPSEFSTSDRKAAVSTDRKAAVSEVRDSFPSEETASLKEPTWRMEFKDAASAAQAAAESAERASMAARAAAELASRGNISKQNSNESNDSSIRGSRDEVPNRVVSSKLKKRSESVNMEYDQEKGFLAMKKEEVHKLPRDELSKGISHHGRTSAEEDMEFSSQMDTVNTFDGFRESFSRKELMGSEKKHDKTGDMEFSSQMDTEKTFDTFQDSFPRKELMGSLKKHDKTGFVEENVRVNYDRSASASSIGTLDDDTIWAPSIGKHQTGNHDNLDQNSHETGSRERIFRYDNEQHVSSDYPAPVFDEYGPKPTDDKENSLDSFDKKQDDQPSIFTTSTSVVNSNIFSDSHDESRPVTVEKDLASKFDDVMSVTFDDSDGLTSESEDDMSRSRKNETVHNSSLVHEKSGLGRDSYPQEELQPSSSTNAKRLMGTEEKNHFQASSSSVGAKDHEMSKLSSEGEFGLKFGRLTGGLRNRGYNHPPYTSISAVDSSLSSQETEGNPIFSTKLISPREKSFTSSGITDEERNEQGSSWTAYPSNPRMPGAYTNQESGKVKGSMSEEYSQESRGNKTLSKDKSEEDTTGFSVKQFVPHKEKNRRYRGGDPNPIEQGPYDSTATNASEVFNLDKTPTKAYKELSSRMPKIDFESDVVEERDSQVNMGNRSASAGIKLSRRTKDFPAKGRSDPSRFTGYSDAPNSEAERQSSRGSSVLEPPSQTVDEAAIFHGKQNLKSSKPNPSAESLHEVSVKRENKKTTEGSPDPDTNSLNKPSDFGGITKLQEAAPLKASHVHPKLPDYETLAAHFRSLRSNRRQT